MSVDVKYSVLLNNDVSISKIPLKFRKVCGFYLNKDMNLLSLEGSPEYCEDDFYCYMCPKLKSLKGGPKIAGGTFSCWGCDSLKSLKYSPVSAGVIESFRCKKITSLDYLTLKCNFHNHDFYESVLYATSVSNVEADKYLLRRILLGDFKYIDNIKTDKAKEKIKPLVVMRDFDLL